MLYKSDARFNTRAEAIEHFWGEIFSGLNTHILGTMLVVAI